MIFYDWEPNSLPMGAQYYYNILTINISVHPTYAEEFFPSGVQDIWYLEQLTTERPRVLHFFVNDEIDEDYDYLIEHCPHTVIEIHPTLGVSWYDMLDFETEDPWRIDIDDYEYDEDEEY